MTEAQFVTLLHLRAIEWANWPSFLSQLYFPLALAFLPWEFVFSIQVFVGLLWCVRRYEKPDLGAAITAAIWVGRLKWLVAVAGCLRPFSTGHPVIGGICLLWPVLAGMLFFGGNVGVIERGVVSGIQSRESVAEKSGSSW